MTTIGLVSCTKRKHGEPARPKELYAPSALFSKTSRYANRFHEEWYILSAKHQILAPDGPPVDPYDETLRGASRARMQDWSRRVVDELDELGLLTSDHTFVFHAGRDYYVELVPLLADLGIPYELPTDGLRLGETLAWYNERLDRDEPAEVSEND